MTNISYTNRIHVLCMMFIYDTEHCGSVTCQNGGFLNSGGYSNCTCFCPADLYGATCEQVATSYGEYL